MQFLPKKEDFYTSMMSISFVRRVFSNTVFASSSNTFSSL